MQLWLHTGINYWISISGDGIRASVFLKNYKYFWCTVTTENCWLSERSPRADFRVQSGSALSLIFSYLTVLLRTSQSNSPGCYLRNCFLKDYLLPEKSWRIRMLSTVKSLEGSKPQTVAGQRNTPWMVLRKLKKKKRIADQLKKFELWVFDDIKE